VGFGLFEEMSMAELRERLIQAKKNREEATIEKSNDIKKVMK